MLDIPIHIGSLQKYILHFAEINLYFWRERVRYHDPQADRPVPGGRPKHPGDRAHCGRFQNTVSKLPIDAGKACAAYRDRVLHGLPCRRIQVDEIRSFIYAKEKNVLRAKAAPPEAGDVWT